jgi:hypothetical protein
MTEVKLHRDHPQSMEERINRRLRNSGDAANSDHVVQKGTGPTRTYTNIDNSRNHTHGAVNEGSPDIHGNKRGVV